MGFWSVTVWSVVEVFHCHGLVHFWGSGVSRPLLVFLTVASGLLLGFWLVLVSRSGPLLGFIAVTVWSAFGVLECHGLVRCWWFSLSRSGPLFGVLECHCLVRRCGVSLSPSSPLLGFWSVMVWSAVFIFTVTVWSALS